MLWFPHKNQRVFVDYDPREESEETAPWVKLDTDGTAQRLRVAQVADRVRADHVEYQFEVVEPAQCATCHTPIPPGEVVESATEWIRDDFCSASCLHECEYDLGVELSPSEARTPYTIPLHFVTWRRADADRVDV